MWAGQRVRGVEDMLVGILCRQVAGLCVGEEGQGLEDRSEEAGRAGGGSARITYHEKCTGCASKEREGRAQGIKKLSF